jgi:release factor glutamine methyltransferase
MDHGSSDPMTDGRPALTEECAMTATTPAAGSARRACEFGPLRVEYDHRVLTPRAWTFEQSRWAAELALHAAAGPILELCAGAGHIGLAAAVLADRDLVQVEADPIAADYARFNAGRAGWAERAEIRTARLQDALRAAETFPVIIADPPYLPTAAVARWPEDPIAAIDGGADGLDLVKACLAVAAEHLTASGSLLLQVGGPAQADHVDRMLQGEASLVADGRRVIDSERAIVRVSRR